MTSNFVTKSKFLARGKPIFILHSGIKFKSREHYFQQIKFSPRIRIVIMNRFNDGNVLASRIYFVGVKMLLYYRHLNAPLDWLWEDVILYELRRLRVLNISRLQNSMFAY